MRIAEKSLAIPRLTFHPGNPDVMKQSALIGLLVAAFFGAPRLASAVIINVDVEGYRTAGGGNNGVPAVTYVGTGAAGGGSVFNSVTATAVSDNSNSTTTGDMQTLTSVGGLLDSTGALTPVNFTIGPIGLDNESAAATPATAQNSLFNDYVFNHSAGNSSNVSFTISGLTPLAAYDVYLYAGFGDIGHLAATSITGGTATAFTPTGIFTAANTVLYAVAADGSGNILGTMGAGTNILAGVTVASPVPEPSSALLFSLGALVLVAFGARRRSA